jgi:ATP-dependent Clp protease ATP-binding subunit ClpA
MLQRIRQRLADMRTIRTLCEAAEKHALAGGEREPGPEHFMLAAFDLPDGQARKVFERLGADPARVRAAIAASHGEALAGIGADAGLLEDDAPLPPSSGPYRAKGSMQHVMQQLAAWPRASAAEPLTGAHVLAVIAGAKQGTAARTLRVLGLDGDSVTAAAKAVIAAG